MRARVMSISFNYASKETPAKETLAVENARRDKPTYSSPEDISPINVRKDHPLASEVSSRPPTVILPDRSTTQGAESPDINRRMELSPQTVENSIAIVVSRDSIDKRSKKKRPKAKPRDEIDDIFDF